MYILKHVSIEGSKKKKKRKEKASNTGLLLYQLVSLSGVECSELTLTHHNSHSHHISFASFLLLQIP